MERISKRHEGDLRGQLTGFDDARQIAVAVNVAPGVAHLTSVQHASWMLLNLLARLTGVVKRLRIICPDGVPISGRVVPVAPSAPTLREALIEGLARLPFVEHVERCDETDVLINVGPIADPCAAFNVYGEAWWGGVFKQGQVPSGAPSPLPFGPYIAACLAAAEVFKRARMRESDFQPVERAFYSAWSFRCTDEPDTAGPAETELCLPRGVLLAGVGAVGSAFIHCLWVMNVSGQLLAADNDSAGIEGTNLNRYSLFGAKSLGKQKASEAAKLFKETHSLRIVPHDGSFEFFFAPPDARPSLILSAVDKNTVRAGIQDQYPGLILSAATSELRAELLRCGPPGIGACLRCFNPPEKAATDDELRAELAADSRCLRDVVGTLGLNQSDVQEWVETGKCGETGDRLLAFLRRSTSEPEQFAVGFVSVAAGVMLTAQLTKEIEGGAVVLGELENRAVLQFWNPLAQTNKPGQYPRQSGCPKCRTEGIAVAKWSERYKSFMDTHHPTLGLERAATDEHERPSLD